MTMLNKITGKNFLVIFFFLASILSATDFKILTEYRNHGIYGLEKQLDQQLTKQSYWKSYLKNKDTTFGYFESYTNILICDKSQSKLSLYKKDHNNSFVLQKEYNAYTGKKEGDKEKEGDLKTPVGIYNIVKKITKVDSFYGPMAFVTSYPNLYDKYRNKTGQGIWIHGLPINQERDSFTKGCIAINNKSIECLDRNIDMKKTVLIINEKTLHKNISKEELSKILSNLFQWRFAWIYNDLDRYLSFYDPTFKRFDGRDFKNFKRYKQRIFNKKEKKTIIFTKINIVPYPKSSNIYQITFKEQYKSQSFSFNGNKVLIVKLMGNRFQILTEH